MHFRKRKDVKQRPIIIIFHPIFKPILEKINLNFPVHTSEDVRQYVFPVPIRCRETSDTGFVAYVYPLSQPAQRFSQCRKDFIHLIAHVLRLLFSMFFSFKTEA
jgi:hypothetical protein